MSKLIVVNDSNSTRIPFLRGMLVKSLQQAGLSFTNAYHVSTDIRDEFDDQEEISVTELRERIEEVLKEDFPNTILESYKKSTIYKENILVAHDDNNTEPFSRATYSKRLECCGIELSKATSITRKVHSHLIKTSTKRITSKKLSQITYQFILDETDQLFADNYLIWRDFLKNSYPLLLLIGGIPGSGKSTVATEVANQLSIVRTQSTDMLREVMRIMIPEKLSPSLHTSSFTAGKNMQISDQHIRAEDHIYYGFMMQSEMVEVACEAVIQRAVNENVSLILEGVHIRPTLLAKIETSTAVVVPICLAVLNQDRLIKFIKGRSSENKQRRAQRYLKHLNEIWQLQTILLSEADNADIEIIDNEELDGTVKDIINVIIQTIAATYKEKISTLRKNALPLSTK